MSEKLSYSNAAFAPFFIGAGVFTTVSVGAWALVYLYTLSAPGSAISPFHWHAHQMIYGYVMAVIAGFLLTVVESWTGESPGRKTPLALLLLWLLARLAFLAGALPLAAVLDLIFVVWLAIAVTLPIARTKQWRQMAVVSKLMLLGLGNLCFYLGVFGALSMGIYWGIYGGLYLVLGLILTMARRLFPVFIASEKPVANSRWLDRASLLFFLAFFISELVAKSPQLSAWLAFGAALVNGARLLMWHRPAIWKNNLLWSFYLSLWMIVAGFLMFTASRLLDWPFYLAIHAMAFGGIGMVTLSMMWRIMLDYVSGQDAGTRAATGAFVILLTGAFFRIVLPLLWPEHYRLWILLSSLCWALAFMIFTIACARIMMAARLQQSRRHLQG